MVMARFIHAMHSACNIIAFALSSFMALSHYHVDYTVVMVSSLLEMLSERF